MEISPFRAIYPNEPKFAEQPDYHSEVNKSFGHFLDQGILTLLNQPAILIHTIYETGTTHTGLIALTSLEDFKAGKIVSHEQTLTTKESDVGLELMERKAMLKPVMLICEYQEEIKEICDQWMKNQNSFFNYVDESKNKHRYWKIDSKEVIKDLQTAFKGIDQSYIADGHHRTVAMWNLFQNQKEDIYQFLLTEYFSFHDLTVFPYHLAINPANTSIMAVMEALSPNVEVSELQMPELPNQKHQILITTGTSSYFIKWRRNILDTYRLPHPELSDTILLNKCILEPILSIHDIRKESTVQYISGESGLPGILKFLSDNPESIVFGLYPIQLAEFKQLTQSNRMLPPKSTRFEPRLPNGIIIHKFE